MSTRSAIFQAPLTRGVRYAPSPTGRFHVGNLRTAWVSVAWARHLGMPWVVRFEDIDQPRVLVGARDQQLADLRTLGLIPDIVLTQSAFRQRHWDLLLAAIQVGQVYPCDCSRKEVQSALNSIASAPHDGLAPVYSGSCRTNQSGSCRTRQSTLVPSESLAWRFRMPHPSGHDDFIVARSNSNLDVNGIPDEASFVPSYHWACAIDDFDGGYDLLVRSVDLFPAAHLQRSIQRWLGGVDSNFEPPAVFHTALVTQDDGHRLEKRTCGVTLPELEKRGFTAEKILQIFSASFHTSLALSRGDLMREQPEQLTLVDLGLSS